MSVAKIDAQRIALIQIFDRSITRVILLSLLQFLQLDRYKGFEWDLVRLS
jgi:hypothetical protein